MIHWPRRLFKNFCFILALSFAYFPLAASAEKLPPLNEKLYYEADFSGINFGKIGIEIDEQADKANITCDITSSGIVALFVKHSSHTTLAATGSNFTYPDRTYESHYHTRKKYRFVKLVYKNGKIISSTIEPPEDPAKRPAVPEADINKAYDLMAFLLQLRSEVSNAKKTGNKDFILNAYDGRRLTRADFKVLGERSIKINGVKQKTFAVSARRKQLAGFTKGEIEDYDPNEPSMTIYFSDDEKLIPLRMEAPFLFQKVSATLVKTCGKDESCLLGIAD